MNAEMQVEILGRLEREFPVADVRNAGAHFYVNNIQVLSVVEIGDSSYRFNSKGTGRYRFSWPDTQDSWREGGFKQTRGNKEKGFTHPYDEAIVAAVAYYRERIAKLEAERSQAANDEGVKLYNHDWSEVTTWDGEVFSRWGKLGKREIRARSLPTHYGLQFGYDGYTIYDTDLARLRERFLQVASLLDKIDAIKSEIDAVRKG
jgi:hypothetical protein